MSYTITPPITAADLFAERKFEPVEPSIRAYIDALEKVLILWPMAHPVSWRADVERVLVDAHRWPLWSSLYELYKEKDTSNPDVKEAKSQEIEHAISSLKQILHKDSHAKWPEDVLGRPDDLIKEYLEVGPDLRKRLAKRLVPSATSGPSM